MAVVGEKCAMTAVERPAHFLLLPCRFHALCCYESLLIYADDPQLPLWLSAMSYRGVSSLLSGICALVRKNDIFSVQRSARNAVSKAFWLLRWLYVHTFTGKFSSTHVHMRGVVEGAGGGDLW